MLVPNVVAGLARGSELIDAAGPGQKVYQVTVSSSHRMSLKALEDLGRGLGYIGNGVAKAGKKLEFHWVVPKSRAHEWIKKAPYKCAGKKEKVRKLIVNRFLKNHVSFYILPLTDEDPITFVEKEAAKCLSFDTISNKIKPLDNCNFKVFASLPASSKTELHSAKTSGP